MQERDLVRDIIEAVQKRLPRAVILKHNDMTTAGIPDISVTSRYGMEPEKRTTWIEVKLLKEKETLSTIRQHFDKLQLTTLRLLANEGHAHYIVGYFLKPPPCQLTIALMDPHDLYRKIYGNDPLPEYNSETFFQGSERCGYFKQTMQSIILDLFYEQFQEVS